METLLCSVLVVCASGLVRQSDAGKTFADMFRHKHFPPGRFPFPVPPIPGWDPDSTPWDDGLYPPLQSEGVQRHRGKPKVVLTSDSPALNGSIVSFTAKLQYPPCQREGADGELLWDEHCEDANGQVHSGYVYNWTSWLEDYGYGKCMNPKRCNVFPDGKPFPQSNDWRHKNYVYVWRTRGQFHETCDGSSSSLSLNTSSFPLGADVMEVLVYRQRERRKYSPLSTDSTVYHVTDQIPVSVRLSQKSALNVSDGTFLRGAELLFQVQLHDPSEFLKSASSLDFLWDFKDGNQLVTHRDTVTHTYLHPGTHSVKLLVEAAFPTECPPAAATATPPSAGTSLRPGGSTMNPGTHAVTVRMATTAAVAPGVSTTAAPPPPSTSGSYSTEPLPATTEGPSTTEGPWLHRHNANANANANQCFRYVHGSFSANITIIEPMPGVRTWPDNRIIDVTTARESKTDVSFRVKCLGSAPSSACTIVSDSSCTHIQSVLCDELPPPPPSQCLVQLRRSFTEPGTYCVNISLEDEHSVALASTTVSISQQALAAAAPQRRYTTEVLVSSGSVLMVLAALVVFMVHRRYRSYRLGSRILVDHGLSPGRVRVRGLRLRDSLFPPSEESRRLLTQPCPL